MGSGGIDKQLITEEIKRNFFEEFSAEDQYTCPQCDLVPEIINVDCITFEITLECPKHGRQTTKIDEYFKNEAEFLFKNAVCDVDFRKQVDNPKEVFNYCSEEDFYLCEKCSKSHCHKKILIELKYKNSRNYEGEFVKYCKTCEEHLTQKDFRSHEKDHIIEEFAIPITDLVNKSPFSLDFMPNYLFIGNVHVHFIKT